MFLFHKTTCRFATDNKYEEVAECANGELKFNTDVIPMRLLMFPLGMSPKAKGPKDQN